MPRDVCVIVVHGINAEAAGYSEKFEAAVLAALPEELRRHAIFREVYWAKHIRDRQKDYLQRAGLAGMWRKMAVQALGDAAAYQRTRRVKNSSYYYVQNCIIEELEYFQKTARPVVFVGHSLGAHIVSSFAWDVHAWRQLDQDEIDQERDEDVRALANRIRTGSPMLRLETFAGFVTLGADMPLFTFTFGPEAVYPITQAKRPSWQPAFPGAGLSEELKSRAQWLNFYNPNDLLGYPLKPLNDAYNDVECLHDIEVHANEWNPYDAHVKYWTNKQVVAGAVGLIRSLIEAP